MNQKKVSVFVNVIYRCSCIYIIEVPFCLFLFICPDRPFFLCLEKDDSLGIVLNSKQRATLQLWNVMSKKREFSFFESFMRKHRKDNDDELNYIQFQVNQSDSNWSGPVCIASLGRFFLKFREQRSGQVISPEKSKITFAAVHIVEEGSTLVLHYHKPPIISLPYRIENCLLDVSITYYQKVTASHLGYLLSTIEVM